MAAVGASNAISISSGDLTMETVDSFLPTSVLEARARKHALQLLNALCDLLEDTQHAEHHCTDIECPVKQAQEVIRRIDPRMLPVSATEQRTGD